jgi:Asp-tRNA(Asn)/Glu-tRNA(Gln) amidotransferase A subunit family amidase
VSSQQNAPSDGIWEGDACSLVEAFRAGSITPPEALDMSLQAIERSELNAFCHIDLEGAHLAASKADIELPFGGVPIGVKELDPVKGWPYSEGSLVFKDRVSGHTSTMVERLSGAGAVLVGQTTASEFGGVNYTHTRIHGTTCNPWNTERTPGGSSGGTAAAVSGGLVTLGTAGDGGGSIRIPAGFTGMFGLKATFGRIPRGPQCMHPPLTVTVGCVSRSVRDTARWFDVCNGHDGRDSLSLPRVDMWESDLGKVRGELTGKRAVISIDLGSAVVSSRVATVVLGAAEALIADAGMRRVEVAISLPEASLAWTMSNIVTLMADLGDLYPECEDKLTPEIQFAVNVSDNAFNLRLAGENERFRVQLNETMADVFDETDFVLCSTNPDVAFAAAGPMATTVDGVNLIDTIGFERALGNNGALTMPANLAGLPAVSIPAGFVDGLPVGLQVIGRQHSEQLLLELASIAETVRPWPLVAPGSPL